MEYENDGVSNDYHKSRHSQTHNFFPISKENICIASKNLMVF